MNFGGHSLLENRAFLWVEDLILGYGGVGKRCRKLFAGTG